MIEFAMIKFPAFGGPEDGTHIEGKGIKTPEGVMWPDGMWTPNGHYYEFIFDENCQPIEFRYNGSKDRL